MLVGWLVGQSYHCWLVSWSIHPSVHPFVCPSIHQWIPYQVNRIASGLFGIAIGTLDLIKHVSGLVFSRVHATLQPALSIGRSVGWSVGPSVTLYFFL